MVIVAECRLPEVKVGTAMYFDFPSQISTRRMSFRLLGDVGAFTDDPSEKDDSDGKKELLVHLYVQYSPLRLLVDCCSEMAIKVAFLSTLFKCLASAVGVATRPLISVGSLRKMRRIDNLVLFDASVTKEPIHDCWKRGN
ncbi:hypothetical protein CQW23_19195 [Capsicum baccatum]|uniref:SAC9 C-terminal domain-containing protein n=1 Tax=Capsicum baccatum TaxID=33114 RepID=A0A2G2W532_CAPBA|nr:hypothetical protein CQW23_19195 [Capsicum baccatum]